MPDQRLSKLTYQAKTNGRRPRQSSEVHDRKMTRNNESQSSYMVSALTSIAKRQIPTFMVEEGRIT